MSIHRLQNSPALIPTPTSWAKALRAATQSPKPVPTHDERDAAAGQTDGKQPSAPLRQAHADVKRGVQDTSRAPEADRAYRKLKP